VTTQRGQAAAGLTGLAGLADVCVCHSWRVVIAWTLALLAGLGLVVAYGGQFASEGASGGSESQYAYRVLQERFPALGGDSVAVVVEAPAGVTQPEVRDRLEDLLTEAATVPHVSGTVSPFDAGGAQQVSPDGRVAFATIQLDVAASDVPEATIDRLIELAEAATSPALEVDLAGSAVSEAQGGPPSEALALVAAAVVLLVAFGSVLAMGLPILTALFGLGIAAAVVGLLMNVLDVTSTTPAIAAMVGMGVGIDYALLVLTRHRGYLAEGRGVRGSVVAAVATAGRSVVFAGSTVIVSLLGMLLLGEPSMYGLTAATVLCVAAMVLASVTLLPALLAITGHHLDRLSVPGLGRAARAGGVPLAYRWSRVVLRYPWPAAVASTLLLVLLALPALDLRLGFPDAGNDPEEYTTRQAYDRLADGFGPGFNGPLILVAELPDEISVGLLQTAAERELTQVPGVASVSPPLLSPDRSVAVLQLVPSTGPQEPATTELVHRLREEALPDALAGTGIRVSVGGATAAGVDLTTTLSERLPLFVAASILLSVGLLVLLLRSPVIAVKAALMNLLSVGAAFGVVTYAISGTWLGQLIGIPEAIPAPAYAPLLMFAILFGLSMDYEIFLMSRIREEYVRTRDNSQAVADGLGATARVITAAAAVMVAVFAAFVLSQEVFLKAVGIGMASAILIDATVIRLVLVPAALKLMGDANWWMPTWLDRLLPRVSSEGSEPVVLPEPVAGGRHRPGRAGAGQRPPEAEATPEGSRVLATRPAESPEPALVGNGHRDRADVLALPQWRGEPEGRPAASAVLVAQRRPAEVRIEEVARDVADLWVEVRRLAALLSPPPPPPEQDGGSAQQI
jgi:RND superfamily putative drug exporter